MLFNAIKSVYIAQHKIDFRKRLAGLMAEARMLELDIYSGDCLVFIHHSKKVIKIIFGDHYGAYLLERLFEKGKLEQRFKFMTDPAFCEITIAELGMLLDGNAFVIEKRTAKWRK